MSGSKVEVQGLEHVYSGAIGEKVSSRGGGLQRWRLRRVSDVSR